MKQQFLFIETSFVQKWVDVSVFVRWGMTFLLATVFWGGWYFLLHEPLIRSLDAKKYEAKDFYTRIQHIVSSENECRVLQERIEQSKQLFFSRGMEDSVYQIIASIVNLVESSGLRLNDYQIVNAVPVQKQWHSVQKIQVSCVGTLPQIAHFYADLKGRFGITKVKNIFIERMPNNQSDALLLYRLRTEVSIFMINKKPSNLKQAEGLGG